MPPRNSRKTASALPADRDELTAQRRSRAHEELLDVRPRESAPLVVLEVTNPLRGTRYRVYAPEYPRLETMACECTDFGHRGLGTCKHIEAAREWLARGPPLPGPEVGPTRRAEAARTWREIDGRLAAIASDERPPSVRLRGPGSVLTRSPVPF